MSQNKNCLVVLDPGHGGSAIRGKSTPYGARGPTGTVEKDVVLDLARRISTRLGGRTVLTRAGDTNLSVAERVEVARGSGCNAFVSLHAGDSGPEVWIHTRSSQRSAALADCLREELSGFGARVRRGELAVLHPGAHAREQAACLVELGGLSDAGSERRLRDPSSLDQVARAIANGVRSYLGELNSYGRARPSVARAMDEPSPYDSGYFKDADQLREMTKDQIAADTLFVSRKSDAIAVVNTFAERPSVSPWSSLDRAEDATRLTTLINNPRLLHQGQLNLCGPAAFLMMWSNRDPVSFANWATSLFDDGQAKIGSLNIAPHSDLLTSDYAEMRKRMGSDVTEQADWMAMGALRNSTEVWWQSDWRGDPDQEFAGLTRPSELADWLRATGIYSTVKDECNLMTSRGLPHALDLMPGGGVDVAFFLNTNALLHNRAKDATRDGSVPAPDNRFILNQFPNHFAVLVNEVLYLEGSQTVSFNLWTWGVPTYHAFEVPLQDFIDNYYGAISCFLRR